MNMEMQESIQKKRLTNKYQGDEESQQEYREGFDPSDLLNDDDDDF